MISHILSKCGESRIIRTQKELAALAPTSIFAIDIETYGNDDLPGDCPRNQTHGVAGIAICNLKGDAAYILVDDNRSVNGIPVADAVAFLNRNWLSAKQTVVLHNCKFDLAFLNHRGLCVTPDRVTIRDTWMISSIRSQGTFTSNKLKEIVKTRFSLDVDTESKIKEWLEAHKTMDYGRVPEDIMAPYACDDVRYTLALHFDYGKLTDTERKCHDLYVRNTLHSNHAECRGVAVNFDLMTARLSKIKEMKVTLGNDVLQHFGSALIDLDDEQSVLKLLHVKEMHPPPRDYYGAVQYVLDDEFLQAAQHPLATSYLKYARVSRFQRCFSGKDGDMRGRIWSEGNVGFIPNFMLSVFSKGGMVICKKPNFEDALGLRNELREMFVPRYNHRLIALKPMNMALQLLAFYAKDTELLERCSTGKDVDDFMCARNGMSRTINSLCLRMLVEGSGVGQLAKRLKSAGVASAESNRFNFKSKFEASIRNFTELKTRIADKLIATGSMYDRFDRCISLPQDKYWRAVALLLQSSIGNIGSLYLDLFCKVARQTNTHLVMLHNNEFVFETSKDNMEFDAAVAALIKRPCIEPTPNWLMVDATDHWRMHHADLQERAAH